MTPKVKEFKTWTLIRSLWYYLSFSLSTLLIGIFAFPGMIFMMSALVFRFAVWWGKMGAILARMKVIVENPEKLYRDGTVIIIANHQSSIDIPAFYSGLDIPFTWMAKASVFRVPIIGRAMKAMRCIPVERDSRKKAMESLFKSAGMIREGRTVVIFPEGTFGKPDGSLGPFKKGGFVLAKMAKVTIQPITIWGTANVAPDIASQSIQRFYPGTARLIYHDPIKPSEFENMEADELSNKLKEIIESPIKRLQKEQPLFRQIPG